MRIKNWKTYQHYKKRNPPWIKLHFAMLSSADWVMLDDASRVLAIACMLLASRNEGEIPDDPEYFQRVAYLNSPPDFKPLLKCGFLEDASAMLADASKMLANACTIEQAKAKALLANACAIAETKSASKMLANDTDDIPKKPKRTSGASAQVLSIYEAYPKKVGRGAALISIQRAIDRGNTPEALLDATVAYAKSPLVRSTDAQFIPNPSTWYNQDRFLDDRKLWRQARSTGNGHGVGIDDDEDLSCMDISDSDDSDEEEKDCEEDDKGWLDD